MYKTRHKRGHHNFITNYMTTTQKMDEKNPSDETKIPSGVRELNLEETFNKFPIENIETTEKPTKKLSNKQISYIAHLLSGTLGIREETAIVGIAELIRKGGANRNTPLFFSVS